MLGYMADQKVAVVQGPSPSTTAASATRATHDDPLRNEQSIFFDVILPREGPPRRGLLVRVPVGAPPAALEVGRRRRDPHGGGGRPHQPGAERRGWRVVYHAEVMALGMAPEEIGAFVVQRGRWARARSRCSGWSGRCSAAACRGAAARVLGELPPLLRGPAAPARLPGPAGGPASGAVPIAASPLLYLAVFLPQFVLVPLASWALTRGRYRPLEGERYAVVRMEGYLRALAALPRRRGRLRGDAEGRPRSRRPPSLRACGCRSPWPPSRRSRSRRRRPRRCSTGPAGSPPARQRSPR